MSPTFRTLAPGLALTLVACASPQKESAHGRLMAVSSPTTPSLIVTDASSARPEGSAFAFVVPAGQGATEFLLADAISIEEVRGTTSTFRVGGSYQIVGRYRLRSGKRATLSASLTTTDARAPASPHGLTAQLTEGGGRFVVELTLQARGYPHLTLYSEAGDAIGGVYFGRDEWLLQSKDWSYATPTPNHSPPDPRESKSKPL